MSETLDVLIVGGGLAGSATALHLSRAGRRVAVVERGDFPREKVCGEGLMPHGVAELRALGLLDAVLATGPVPFHGVVYRLGPLTARGGFPAGRVGLGLRRSRVDRVLHLAAAAAPGVDVHLDTGVRDVRVERDGVRVLTTRGELRARAVIGADGLSSLVRRKAALALPSRGPARYGARLHVRLAPGAPRLDHVEVHLLSDLEVYLTPTAADELNVAVLCEHAVARGFGQDLDGAVRARLLREPALATLLRGSEPLTPASLWGPLRQRTRCTVADRTLLVGDAAGFVDALTGEGMSLSLIAARLASATLDRALAADRLSARDLMPYHRARARRARLPYLLTELLVRGIQHRALAHLVVGALARQPRLFDAVLAVNAGVAPWAAGRPGVLARP